MATPVDNPNILTRTLRAFSKSGTPSTPTPDQGPRGLSDIPSSLSPSTEESGNGVIRTLRKMTGVFQRNPVEVADSKAEVTAENPLQSSLELRIQKAEDIIRGHFRYFINHSSQLNDLRVVVVLKYNGQVSVYCGEPSQTASGKPTQEGITHMKKSALAQLEQFLSHENNKNCENGELKIETLTFKNSSENPGTYDYHRRFSSVQFPDGNILEIPDESGELKNKEGIQTYLEKMLPTDSVRKILKFVTNEDFRIQKAKDVVQFHLTYLKRQVSKINDFRVVIIFKLNNEISVFYAKPSQSTDTLRDVSYAKRTLAAQLDDFQRNAQAQLESFIEGKNEEGKLEIETLTFSDSSDNFGTYDYHRNCSAVQFPKADTTDLPEENHKSINRVTIHTELRKIISSKDLVSKIVEFVRPQN